MARAGNRSILVVFLIVGAIGSLVFSSLPREQAFAATSAEIRENYLEAAKLALQNGNTTGAIRDIIAILEWEFNEVHPKIESYLGNVTVTASG
jgi:hypothetical protein